MTFQKSLTEKHLMDCRMLHSRSKGPSEESGGEAAEGLQKSCGKGRFTKQKSLIQKDLKDCRMPYREEKTFQKRF